MKPRILPALLLTLALAACASDDPTVGTTGGTAPSDPTGVTAPTGATGTTAPTGATGETGTPPAELEDGEHFGFVEEVDPSGGSLVFDLAYFLTGEAANEAAAERGDEVPVPNDYYIVNDNDRLRTLTLADGVELSLLDWNNCCDERFDGDLETFARAIEEGMVESDGFVYQGSLSPYWLTVEDGEIVRIEEQYLP
ncbi:MAG TPA: hypothetical protein VJ913_03915 [Actinomycetota bacterium]|nr:hypothetical protein [Actinomycetota bacterium]